MILELYDIYDQDRYNPMCCERCQSPSCDCHGECCTYCNGYALEQELAAWEEELGSDESEG